jgi:Arc/MetJ family transcription regulator
MRTRLTLDDGLVERARELTGIKAPSALVCAALRALIERESSRRLARLEGIAPDLGAPPRHRGH